MLDKDRNEGGQGQRHGVEAHAHYQDRREREDGAQQQRLGAPGDEPLHDAGEDVEHGGGAARGDPVLLGEIPGHLARHYDGHRVVGGTEVGEAHHPGDAELGRFLVLFAVVAAGEAGDEGADARADPGQATLALHQGAEAADEHGEQEDLLHAGEALIDVLAELAEGIAPQHPHAASGDDAEPQHHEDVHARERQHQDQQIGRDLEHVRLGGGGRRLPRGAQHQIEQDDQHGGGGGNLDVLAELILHLAALAAGRGYGGVGDDGEVVAKHGAGEDGARHQHRIDAGGLGDAEGHGGDGTYGAHGGAHGGGNKGRDEEEPRQQAPARDQRQTESDRGIHPAGGLGHGGKGARQQIDEAHGHDVAVADPFEEGLQVLVEPLASQHQGQHDGGQGGDGGGQLVKGELDPLQGQPGTGTDKESKKDQKGQQGSGTGLGLDHVFLET